VIKPGDTVHENVFGPEGARTLQIALPKCELIAYEGLGFRGWGWTHGGPAVAGFLRLWKVLKLSDSGSSDAQAVARAVCDALACCEQLSSGAKGDAPQWLRRVHERLSDEPSGHTVAQLATQADVHPVYLAQQFRRWFGTSITEFVRRHKTQCAAQLMAHGTLRLSPVAHASGFTDHAHLCRTFKRETGMTPGSFRRLALRVDACQLRAADSCKSQRG